MEYVSRVSQMQAIVNVIGIPDESEIAKFKDEKARKYLRNLQQRKKRKLKRRFPGADKHALDLFTQLLKFDVDKRITMDQALQHPYLKPVKDFGFKQPIKLELYSFEFDKLSEKKARGIFVFVL